MTRARSFSRGLGALVGLGGLIIGVPLGLMLVSRAALGTRSPLAGVKAPWRWSMTEIRSTLAHHVTESTLIDVIVRVGVCVVWACLAVVLLTTIAELISQLRHGVALPTVRGLGWSQRIATGIVAGLLTFAPMAHSARPAVGALAVREVRPAATMSIRQSAEPLTAGGSSRTASGPTQNADPAWGSHRVAPGESVWDIGARLAGGDAEQTHAVVRRILDANLGRRMGDGSVFNDPGYIESGWSLAVPTSSHSNEVGTEIRMVEGQAAPGPATSPAKLPSSGEHRVAFGDTLWQIVDQHYGHVDADMIWRLADINHLENPSSIPIGTVLSLPPLDALNRAADLATMTASAGPSTAAEDVPQGTPTVTVVVRRGDTLSSIAEQEFGDSEAWPVIFDANHDRKFGDRTFTDPNLILPGWTLSIPDDTTSAALPPPKLPAPSVAASSPLPPPAVAAMPAPTVPPAPAPAVPTAPTRTQNGTQPSTQAAPTPVATGVVSASVAAAVQVSTDVGVSPPSDVDDPVADPPGATAASEPPSGDTTRSPTPDSSAAPAPVPGPVAGQESAHKLPLGPASALVIATGAVSLIEARRRRRLRAAGYSTLSQPDPGAAAFEAQLRHRSRTERLARLDLAVRCAAPHLANGGLTLRGALIASNGQIELLLDGADEALEAVSTPFERGAQRRSWCLPASVPTEDIPVPNRFAAFPCPLLVHLGLSDGDDVFVDLEAFGTLAVIGDPGRAASIVQGVMSSLALSPFAETVTMMCVGMSVHAGALPRLHHYETLSDAFGAVSETAVPLHADVGDDETTFNLRARSSGEAWEPAILSVTATALDDQQFGDYATLAATGRGVVVIADRPFTPSSSSLTEVSDGWLLTPLGITLQPVGLTDDDLIELDELIADADIEPVPVPRVTIADHQAAFQEREWALMVRLLGPVDVVDAAGQAAVITKSKALELVAWLAEHRTTATRSGARSAMWDADVRDATFANVVSEARRSLARLVTPPEGMEWIGRTLTEQLPLHPHVLTDATILQQRLDFARSCADDEEAVFVLQPGLQLVRDIPYAGVSYLWSDAEGSMSNLTLLITAAATELAERYLRQQDLAGVFWATGRGLVVLPGHEDLIGLRMRARAVAGDFAGVRTEWDSYERVLNADSWSDGEPSPKMTALRQELLRPSLTGLR